MDICNGFYQVEIEEEDRPKTSRWQRARAHPMSENDISARHLLASLLEVLWGTAATAESEDASGVQRHAAFPTLDNTLNGPINLGWNFAAPPGCMNFVDKQTSSPALNPTSRRSPSA